jgi:hypothetical protein
VRLNIPPQPLKGVGFFCGRACSRRCRAGHFCRHASETLALPARATLGTRASRPPCQPREKKPTPLRRQGAPARVLARAHQADRVRHIQRAQRLGVAPPAADAQQPSLRASCRVEPRTHPLQAGNPARYFGATRGGVGVAGVGVFVEPACPREAYALSSCARTGRLWGWVSSGHLGWSCPCAGRWCRQGRRSRAGGRARRGGCVGTGAGKQRRGRSRVGSVGRSGWGWSWGRGVGCVRVGDGFACGGDEFSVCEVLVGAVGFGSCGVEGCGADEVLEVVYWVCVVVLPIGLSCPVKFVVCHSRDRDTRWAFCCSRGVWVWGC